MNIDQQLKMFVNQAAWLEAEYAREIRRRRVNWKRIAEIRTRNAQLTCEFETFLKEHKS